METFKIPFKDDVFGSRHNHFFIKLGRPFKNWFEKAKNIKNVEEKPRIYECMINLWASHLHECMQPSNPKRIQFVHASVLRLSSYTDKAAANQTRINAFFEVMKENPARIYLCPYLRDGHFVLLVIVPEASTVYYIDPAASDFMDECCFEFCEEITELYDEKLRIDDNEEYPRRKLEVVEKIVLETEGIDILKHFPPDDGPYSCDEIDALAQKLCRLFVRNVFPICRKQIETGLDYAPPLDGSLIPVAVF